MKIKQNVFDLTEKFVKMLKTNKFNLQGMAKFSSYFYKEKPLDTILTTRVL